MRNKHLLLFFLLAAMFMPLAAQAEIVEIGDPESATTQYTLPVNMFYNYSLTQQIFPACEIGTAGTINSIAFDYTNTSAFSMEGVQVYMMLTDKSSFGSNTDMVALDNATLVWEGTFAAEEAGWVTINLTTPFVLDGSNNLLVCCYDPTNGYPGSAYKFRTTATQEYLGIAYYSDGTVPSLDDVSTFSGNKGLYQYRTNIQLGITPDPSVTLCCPPDAVTVPTETVTAHEAVVNWEGDAGTYNVQYKKASDEVWTDALTNSSATTTTLSNLTQNTLYNVRVQAACGSAWKSANFTTLIACPAPTDLAVTLTPGDGTVATFRWTETGEATSWQLCLNNDENNLIDMDENPFTYNNFTPEESYTAKVRAYCDETDQSSWSNTVSFTPTNAYSITVNDGTATSSTVPVYGYWVDNHSKSQFIIPAADLEDMQWGIINKLTFYSNSGNVNWGNAQFEVYMTEVNYTAFEAATLVDWSTMDKVMNAGSLGITDNVMEVTLDAPYQYMGGNLLIGILQPTSGTYVGSNWYGVTQTENTAIGGYESSKALNLQKFLPKTTFYYEPGEEPSCMKPTGLTINYTGGLTAEVSWTSEATAWNVRVNGELAPAPITNPYTLTGLELATTYEVEVQAICGENNLSEWSNPISFTTDLCMPENQCEITYELADSYGDGWNGNTLNVVDVATGETIATWTIPSGGSSASGSLALCEGREIQFVWAGTSWPYENSFTVYDINGDIICQHIKDDNGPSVGVLATYTMDCTVSPCRKPTDLAASEIGPRTATVTWVENGEATAWAVEITDEDGGQITTWNATETRYTILGLTPLTNYSVRINPVCDIDKWSDPITFTTTVACPAPSELAATEITPFGATIGWTSDNEDFVFQYREMTDPNNDFEASSLKNWKSIDADGDGYGWVVASVSPGIYHNTNAVVTGNGHNDSYDFVISGSYTNVTGTALTPDNYLVSPQINLGGSITFWAQAQDASYPEEHFGVAVSTTGNNASDFTTIEEWTMTAKSTGAKANFGTTRSGNRVTGEWYEYSVDLSNYSGRGYVAIRHFNCSDQFLLNVDDIVIEQPNYVTPEWITVADATNPYTFTDLEPETAYEVQIQNNCGEDGNSSWAYTWFLTLSNCAAPTALNAVPMPESATLSWNGYHDAYNVRYYIPGHVNFSEDMFEQISEEYTAQDMLTTYTIGLSNYQGIGHVAIRHYNVTDMFFLNVDDIVLTDANGTEIVNEDFETGALPSGWLYIDNDGDGFNWDLRHITSQDANNNDVGNGSYCATTASFDNNAYVALTPDNWLIIPNVELGGTLTFVARGQDPSYAEEVFAVYVSTSEDLFLPDSDPIVIRDVTDPSVVIEGLEPNTTYAWQVQGVNPSCNNGEGADWSEPDVFTTPDYCDEPIDLLAENITHNSATLSWTGYQDAFDLRYREAMQIDLFFYEDFTGESIAFSGENLGEGNNDMGYASGWYSFTDGTQAWIFFPDTELEGSQYIISDEMYPVYEGTTLEFGVASSVEGNVFRLGFSSTDNNIESFTWSDDIEVPNQYVEFEVPEGTTYFAIEYPETSTGYTYFLDFIAYANYVPAGEWITVDRVTSPYQLTGLDAEVEYEWQVMGLSCSEDSDTEWSDSDYFTTTAFKQILELTAGYNWVSFDLEIGDPIEMLDMLKAALGENGVTIEADGILTEYLDGEWFGDLDEEGIYNEQMYLINVSADCTVELEGTPILDPSPYEINLHPGYNWFGFPYSEEVEINFALSNFEAEEEDYIEVPEGISYYYGEWIGDIETLVPGQGYMYFTNIDNVLTFTVPETNRARHTNHTFVGKLMQKHGHMSFENKYLKGFDNQTKKITK